MEIMNLGVLSPTKHIIYLLLSTFTFLNSQKLPLIVTQSSSTIPVVASGSYRFTNVSAELAYVFQLPKNFSYFSIKAEVKVPDPSWFYEKSYQSKLLFYESSVPYIYTGPGKTYVLKIYNDPSHVSNDSFSTRKAGWYLIVHFMPSYNFVISGDLLNLTVTAANTPEKDAKCSEGTFNCTPSPSLCLTKVALFDGVRNCENGHDEITSIDRAPNEPYTKLKIGITFAIGLLIMIIMAIILHYFRVKLCCASKKKPKLIDAEIESINTVEPDLPQREGLLLQTNFTNPTIYAKEDSYMLADLKCREPMEEGKVRVDITPNRRDLLWRGGVPSQPRSYVDRTKIISDIRMHLKSLAKSKTGRLLITGMGGMGKSVLAAESLRSDEILHLFPGGIVWMSVGKNADSFQVCRNIAMSLNCFDADSINLVQVQQDIRSGIAANAPTLTVLDDVWEISIARDFDCLNHVVITSRTSEIVDSFRGDIFTVKIDCGFSKEESVLVLLGDKASKESIVAEDLHDICKGWPLMISIIGSHLRELPQHLKYFSRLAGEGRLDSIKTISSDYPYENAEQVIAVSYDDLNDTMQWVLKFFALFDSDDYVSAQTMSVILDRSREEVERMLDMLVQKSLVMKKMSTNGLEYGVHSIMRAFLERRVHTKELARTVLEQYSRKCRDYWWTLQVCDDRIWWYLTKFMRQAELETMLEDFLTDLRSLEAMLKHTHFKHVLGEYESTKDLFDMWNKRKLWEAFHSFLQINEMTIESIVDETESVVCSNGSTVLIEKKFKDMIQLALFMESEDSPVYEAARKVAGDRHWIKRDAVEPRRVIWDVPGGGKDFDLSPDSKMIAVRTSAGGRGIPIRSLEDGKELFFVEKAHQIFVKFDKKGTRIVSAGCKSITVWSLVNIPSPDYEIDLDVSRIAAVSFSHDNKDVLALSEDGCVLRWSPLSGKLSKKSSLGQGAVKWPLAAFSDDSKILAVLHDDSTFIVYDSKKEKMRKLASYPGASNFTLFPLLGEGESRIAFWEHETVRIWDYKGNTILHEFILKDEIWRVAISRCQLFLAVATEGIVRQYSLETLHEVSTCSDFDVDKIALICTADEGDSSSHPHSILTVHNNDNRLSMRTLQYADPRTHLKPLNCWALKNGRSIILSCSSDGRLEVLILYAHDKIQVKGIPGLSESIQRGTSNLLCCLNSEGTRLIVAMENRIHSFSIKWSVENFVTEIKPAKKQETKYDIAHILFVNEQSDCLFIDCRGNIKMQSGSRVPKVGQLEMTGLVDVLYLQKRRSLLVAYETNICVMPLESTTSSSSSKQKVVFATDDNSVDFVSVDYVLIDNVSLNSDERYVAVGIASSMGCVVTDLRSSQQVQITTACAIEFHPIEANILCIGGQEGVSFYLINSQPMTTTEIGRFKVSLDKIGRLSWSPDGEYLTVCSDDCIHLLSVKYTNGNKATVEVEMLWTMQGHSFPPIRSSLSTSSKAVIAVDGDDSVHIACSLSAE